MNATYIRIELTRQVRDGFNLLFVIALPVTVYLPFGTQAGTAAAMMVRARLRPRAMASPV